MPLFAILLTILYNLFRKNATIMWKLLIYSNAPKITAASMYSRTSGKQKSTEAATNSAESTAAYIMSHTAQEIISRFFIFTAGRPPIINRAM